MRTELKVFRVKQGLSQAEIAERLGYSRAHYALIESGKRDITLRFLQALVNAFAIPFVEAQQITLKDNE